YDRAEKMGGIKCNECGVTVSSVAAALRLLADLGTVILERIPRLACISAGANCSTTESGILAEQYNGRGYKCVNGHSGRWVDA
ncbi:unnamed protein product, partial [Didymodactylos carnosus]